MTRSTLCNISLFTLLTLNTAYADITGGEISLGAYSHSPSGTASYTLPYIHTQSTADLEETFGWETEYDIMFKAYIEHPVPLIPNVRLAYTPINYSGTGFGKDFNWGELNINGAIDTELSMSMTDLTAYYELLDSDVELDVGLTLRYLSGNIDVIPHASVNTAVVHVNAALSESVSLDSFAPMLYAKVRVNVPGTDISLQLEGNGLGYGDTLFYDYELGARYTFGFGLGIEGGYKMLHLDSEDLTDGLDINLESSGFYTSVIWDF